MQDDPDLQMAARLASTFHLDPVAILNDLSPVQLAALLAAHNVVAADQRLQSDEQARALERLRQQQRR
jgi:hypothetical protein